MLIHIILCVDYAFLGVSHVCQHSPAGMHFHMIPLLSLCFRISFARFPDISSDAFVCLISLWLSVIFIICIIFLVYFLTCPGVFL